MFNIKKVCHLLLGEPINTIIMIKLIKIMIRKLLIRLKYFKIGLKDLSWRTMMIQEVILILKAIKISE